MPPITCPRLQGALVDREQRGSKENHGLALNLLTCQAPAALPVGAWCRAVVLGDLGKAPCRNRVHFASRAWVELIFELALSQVRGAPRQGSNLRPSD